MTTNFLLWCGWIRHMVHICDRISFNLVEDSEKDDTLAPKLDTDLQDMQLENVNHNRDSRMVLPLDDSLKIALEKALISVIG